MSTLVVDNGAGILKAGLLTPGLDVTKPSLDAAPVRLPNCTAKSRAEKKFFVADGLDTAVELSALYIRRPHDRGYVVNWDLQGDIWQRMCHTDVLGIKPGETSVLVSEPLFCPGEIKDNMAEFIFEEMGFQVRPRPSPLQPRPPPARMLSCTVGHTAVRCARRAVVVTYAGAALTRKRGGVRVCVICRCAELLHRAGTADGVRRPQVLGSRQRFRAHGTAALRATALAS